MYLAYDLLGLQVSMTHSYDCGEKDPFFSLTANTKPKQVIWISVMKRSYYLSPQRFN